MRVFIAVDIEDPLLVSKLSELKRTIAASNTPLKLVEDENMHITLAFLGEISESDVEALTQEMNTAFTQQPFKIRIRGLGAFPNPMRPRVVWAGVDQGEEELQNLHKSATQAARRAGISFRAESFHPHITLARVKGFRNVTSLTRIITELQDVEIGEMIVKEVRLKQSTLTPRGPIYKTIHQIRL